MFENASAELDYYYEKMSDIHKQELYNQILYAEDELKNIAFERENCTVMRDLEDIYQREDESAIKLISSFAQYYNFLLQPYLDSISLSNKKIQEYKTKMTDDNLPEATLDEYKEKHLYWACLLMQTKEVVQNLYIEHRTAIVSIFKELLEQIYIDKKRYGSNAFDLVAASRELHLRKELYSSEEQLLQSKRKSLKLEKDKIDIQIPPEEETKRKVDREILQAESDSIQTQIYSIEIDILNSKRKTLSCQIEIRKRELTEERDANIEFHDAVEDVEELSSDEDAGEEDERDEELAKLKKERINVSQHQSKIRTKKERFVNSLKQKKAKEAHEVKRKNDHHAIQMKRDLRRDEEEKRSSVVFEERKKTIERLKEYRMKYTTPPTIKPPRYQRPSERTKDTGTKQNKSNKTTKSKDSPTSSGSRTPSRGSARKRDAEKPWKKSGRQKVQDVPVTIHVSKEPNSTAGKEGQVEVSSAAPPPPPPPSSAPPSSAPPPHPPPSSSTD